MSTVTSDETEQAEQAEELEGSGAALGERPDALFHMAGASEQTLQWKAETFQLVNWGGFEGRAAFPFHADSTLVTGASGTGKSTLLDAYIALMMPNDAPFNGASNDATGRARGSEQRNLISYLRGQTDTTIDEGGRHDRPLVLRGDRTATWGAVGMTFVDDHDRRLTVFRAYRVAPNVTSVQQILMRMGVVDGHLDLADLERFATSADSSLVPRELKAAFPSMTLFESYSAFANTLYARLGIGAGGDGAKALRLLVRIQAGHQIRTVDALYKEMVLEEPSTYAAADRALAHFDDLETNYQAMQTEEEKVRLLGPIPDLETAREKAAARIETLDLVGVTSTANTVLTLWMQSTRCRLLEQAETTTYETLTEATRKEQDAARRVAQLDGDLALARQQHSDSGGGELQSLTGAIAEQEILLQLRTDRRKALLTRVALLGETFADEAAFTAAQQAADAFLATAEQTTSEHRSRRDAVKEEEYPLLKRRSELRGDLESFLSRRDLVPPQLHEMRRQVAEASGIAVTDLPFAAELMDVEASQARWRPAIETVLGGLARTLLLPRAQLTHFSASIDALHLRGRLQFEAVPDLPPRPFTVDEDRICGKLTWKESRYTPWLQQRIREPHLDALCVPTPADLDGGGFRVTPTGQTRQGTRGAHGRSERRDIIGFDNAALIAALRADLEQVDADLAVVSAELERVDTVIADHDAFRQAHRDVAGALWDDIDVASVTARITELTQARERLLAASDVLAVLEARIAELGELLEAARETKTRSSIDVADLRKDHERFAEEKDAAVDDVIRLERAGILLSEEHAAWLDAELAKAAAPDDPDELARLDSNLVKLQTALKATLAGALEDVKRITDRLRDIFARYQEKWPDPNLGSTAESYRDYADILERILQTGLHERREKWRATLTEWSGQDLVPLNQALDDAVNDIVERLEPVNDILRRLPFGARRNRLRIALRRLTPDHVVRFRRQLRRMSQAATLDLDEEQTEARFKELQRFMAQLRKREDPRAVAGHDRNRLLDVRRHVEITAEQFGQDGRVLSTYSTLAGKSGGETQELVAFIIGAALRFRLGDDENDRPRFAPVFLDEGFIKADGEFAGRAVAAWRALGFQLVVGAPLDKVTGLEPWMDEMLLITKDLRTSYSFVQRITGPRTPTASDAPTALATATSPHADTPDSTAVSEGSDGSVRPSGGTR